MRDSNPPAGPEGPASPNAPTQPAGRRSGEGSASVLAQLLKDTSRKAADASHRAPARTDQDAQAAR